MEDTMKITAETLQVEVVPGKLIDNPEQLGAIFNTISRSELLAVDTETTGLDFTRDQLHGFSVAVPGDDLSWYIAGPALIPGLRALADVVKQPNKLVIGHNYKFDAHFLRRHSVYPAKIADTIVAQWLVDENLELGLKSLAYTRLGYDNLPTYGDLLMKMKRLRGVSSKNDVSIYDFPPEVIATYAARDAALTLELWQKLAFDLRSEGMEKHFWEIEMPFADALTEMEENGMFIDQVAVAELKNEWQGEADKLLARWNELTNGVNPNSGPQLRTFFFTTLKLPVQDKTKTGLPSTDDLTMQRLAPKDKSGSVEVLREYRKYQKLLSTYVSFMETAPVEGRVHGSFNHTGATTGRLSCVDGDTKIETDAGTLCIRDLNPFVGYRVTGHSSEWCRVTDKIYKGKGVMYHVTLENGSTITCTPEHKFLSDRGWQPLARLSVGDTLLVSPSKDKRASKTVPHSDNRGESLQENLPGAETDNLGNHGSVPSNEQARTQYEHVLLQAVLPGGDASYPLWAPQELYAREQAGRGQEEARASERAAGSTEPWLHTATDGGHPAAGTTNSFAALGGVRPGAQPDRQTKPAPAQGSGEAATAGAVRTWDSGSGHELCAEPRGVLREAVPGLLRSPEANLVCSGDQRQALQPTLGEGARQRKAHSLDNQQSGNHAVSGAAAGGDTPRAAVHLPQRRQQPLGSRLLSATVEPAGRSGWLDAQAGSREAGGQGEGRVYEEEQPEISKVVLEDGDEGYCIGDTFYQGSRIKSVEYAGVRDVWDISVEGDHSYVAQGFVNHNSSDPNLQNIPSKGALAHSMRKVFAAQSRDDIIVDIDYSQIELRLIAHYTKDPSLMKVFFEGLDPHQMTADLVGVPRWLGKTLNFAVSYGSGPRTLGDTIEKSGKPRPSEAESKGWLEGFGKAYPGISSWKRAAVDYARQLGYAKTIAGRKRRLPELTSYDRSTQGHAERQAISAIIQGSAADAFKWATVQFMPMVRWYDAKLTAEVHDEAVFEVPYECAEEFAQQVGGVMASIREQFNLRVPIEAAPSFGFNWGDAKENDGTIPPLESRR